MNHVEGVPDGWRLVAIRKMRDGERFLDSAGRVRKFCEAVDPERVAPVVEKVGEKSLIDLSSWSESKMTTKQRSQFAIEEVGESFHSCRKCFKVSCKKCKRVLHESTNDPSFHMEMHPQACEPPKPKYRPFVNAVEFMSHPLANDWIDSGGEYFEKITTCTNSGITFDDCELYSYQRALHELKFSDGTPFGVEVNE